MESKKGKKKGKKMDEKRRDSNASDKSEEGDSKRTNQFSFVERATQTMNNALKVEKKKKLKKITQNLFRVATCRQSHRANFCETVNQWVIYDSYVAYETAKEVAEEKEQKKEQKEVKSMRKRLQETPKENNNDEVNKRMLLINFCKTLSNLGEESVTELLMGKF